MAALYSKHTAVQDCRNAVSTHCQGKAVQLFKMSSCLGVPKLKPETQPTLQNIDRNYNDRSIY